MPSIVTRPPTEGLLQRLRVCVARWLYHGVWTSLGVRQRGRRFYTSLGHIEERLFFFFGLRFVSPAKAFFGKMPIFIGRGHTALPWYRREHYRVSQSPAPDERPLPLPVMVKLCGNSSTESSVKRRTRANKNTIFGLGNRTLP